MYSYWYLYLKVKYLYLKLKYWDWYLRLCTCCHPQNHYELLTIYQQRNFC